MDAWSFVRGLGKALQLKSLGLRLEDTEVSPRSEPMPPGPLPLPSMCKSPSKSCVERGSSAPNCCAAVPFCDWKPYGSNALAGGALVFSKTPLCERLGSGGIAGLRELWRSVAISVHQVKFLCKRAQ